MPLVSAAWIAPISAAEAVAWGLVGPNLRGSGVDWDLRRDEPYGIYGQLGVRVPFGQAFAGRRGVVGDCFDRYVVRLLEIQESVRLCREALKLLPPKAEKATDPTGGFQADVKRQGSGSDVVDPAGSVVDPAGSARGEPHR